ncbi:MAG: SpoIIE family protein phosphatase, partial [Acidobacteriota bacterium]
YLVMNVENLLLKEYRTFQGNLVTRDGRPVPILFNANTLRDRGGNIIGNAVFATDLTEQKKALQLAAEVQRSLRPKESPKLAGVEIAGASISCEEVGGDYFDYLDYRGGSSGAVSIVVGDVTGHGVDAALLMTSARAFLRSGIMGEKGLGELIDAMNRQLMEDMVSTGRFMTLFCMALEPERRRVLWIRAGHDPALLYLPESGTFEELKGVGLPLGIEERSRYKEYVRENLPPGAVIAVGTDGIWEARNIGGAMYGKERFREVIREHAGASAEELLQAIFSDLRRFTIGVGLRDDATLVIAKLP